MVRKELTKPGLNLGLGIDCSDSLLYEGETGLARRLIPLFTSKKTNPFGRKLILLTKSINVHYLEGLPITNILVTFSLNPELIADLWEGKWNDGLRITPPIEWIPEELSKEGMHYHIPGRLDIYRQLMGFIKSAWWQAETIPVMCPRQQFYRQNS